MPLRYAKLESCQNTVSLGKPAIIACPTYIALAFVKAACNCSTHKTACTL